MYGQKKDLQSFHYKQENNSKSAGKADFELFS